MTTTPAHRKKAKKAMADAEDYIRELVRQLRAGQALDFDPELAAMADEAHAHTAGLRKARIDL